METRPPNYNVVQKLPNCGIPILGVGWKVTWQQRERVWRPNRGNELHNPEKLIMMGPSFTHGLNLHYKDNVYKVMRKSRWDLAVCLNPKLPFIVCCCYLCYKCFYYYYQFLVMLWFSLKKILSCPVMILATHIMNKWCFNSSKTLNIFFIFNLMLFICM